MYLQKIDNVLKVAHAFATKLTMYLSLIILSALEFHSGSFPGDKQVFK